MNDYTFFGVLPAIDACEGLAELVHGIIAGSTLDQAVKLSLCLCKLWRRRWKCKRVRRFRNRRLKRRKIQQELDIQWQIYRALKDCKKERDTALILGLKNELRQEQISNIGIEIEQ